jgi:hypothetical protein
MTTQFSRLLAGFLGLWLLCCGGGSVESDGSDEIEAPEANTTENDTCAQRVGTYTTTFAERDGTCGPIPEQIETIDEQPTEPAEPCTGSIDYSADNCRVTFDQTCPEPGLSELFSTPDVTSRFDGIVTWSENGASGSGVVQFVVMDAAGLILCQSTYDYLGTKL